MKTILWSLAAFALLSHQADAQAGPGGFRARYELVKADIAVNEPLFVRFLADNGGIEGVTFDVSVNEQGNGAFRARLVRPDGREVQAPTPALSGGGTAARPHLAPR